MTIESLQLDFGDVSGRADVVRSRTWRGVTVEFSRLRLPDQYGFRWNGHSHYLALHDLVLDDGEMIVDGSGEFRGRDIRRKMTYVPQECSVEGWAKPAERQNSFTIVYFDPAEFATELNDLTILHDGHPLVYFDDPALRMTLEKLGDCMGEGETIHDTMYAETLGLLAAIETFRLQKRLSLKQTSAPALAVQQERLIRDYIEDNLGNDLTLEELAALSGLSRFHFARAFKGTFGMPPHRYVNFCRVERAKRLLPKKQLSIVEVGSAVGFSSAAQFGRVFRQVTGSTPGEFRRRAL